MRKASTNQRSPKNGATAPITIAFRLLAPRRTLRPAMMNRTTDKMEAMKMLTAATVMIVMRIAKPAMAALYAELVVPRFLINPPPPLHLQTFAPAPLPATSPAHLLPYNSSYPQAEIPESRSDHFPP